jgi:hypothetical protein
VGKITLATTLYTWSPNEVPHCLVSSMSPTHALCILVLIRTSTQEQGNIYIYSYIKNINISASHKSSHKHKIHHRGNTNMVTIMIGISCNERMWTSMPEWPPVWDAREWGSHNTHVWKASSLDAWNLFYCYHSCAYILYILCRQSSHIFWSYLFYVFSILRMKETLILSLNQTIPQCLDEKGSVQIKKYDTNMDGNLATNTIARQGCGWLVTPIDFIGQIDANSWGGHWQGCLPIDIHGYLSNMWVP